MKTWLFLMIANYCFAMPTYTLPEVLVTATRVIPVTTNGKVDGYSLIKSYNGEFRNKVLLLAAYIHTQSIGEKDMLWLADKYGVAQVVLAQLEFSKLELDKWLLTKSSTVRDNKSKYFWIDSNEYYSQQCIYAAYNVLINKIPNEFSVNDAQAFLHESSISESVRKKWKPSKINRVFIHTFYRF